MSNEADELLADLLGFGGDHLIDKERDKWIKSCIGMPGGKYRSLEFLIPQLKQRLPTKGKWIDVFGGTGVVSFNMPTAFVNVFNDRYSALTDFYKLMRDREPELRAYLQGFAPHSRQQFYESKMIYESETDPLKRAAHWYYVTRCSVYAKRGSFARCLNEPYGQDMITSLKLWPMVKHKLETFTIENLDAITLMDDYDSPNALFYLDPPYVETTQSCYGVPEYTEANLRRLLDKIRTTRGCCVLSHYPNKLIDSQDYWDEVDEWSVTVTVESRANMNTVHMKQGQTSRATEKIWIKEAH